MTAPIWMGSPPEVHSALLSSGPGPGPLLASAGAWTSLSIEYAETADELTALLGAVQAGAWEGPTVVAYVGGHAPYLAWLMQTSVSSAAMAAQQEVAAAAYTAALAAMPTLAELAANHATHAALVATNFFGINAIPIALNEADYVRMWIQAATVMSTYQAVANAAMAAAPQTTPAPETVKANAAASPPDTESQIEQFLQNIGYDWFYNNILVPLAELINLPGGGVVDPYLPILGNPFAFLSPTNIAFALGYPMDIGSFIAYLSETFSFIGADITAAFATGNPTTITSTLIYGAVEAIGTVITDVIALLKPLIEQAVLLPLVMPLLTAPMVPLAAMPPAVLGGLAGLAGLHGIPPVLAPAVIPPIVPLALAPTPPIPAAAPIAAVAPAAPTVGLPPPAPALPPPPPPAPPLAPVDSFAYLVGGLSLDARRAASTSARRKKAPEPDSAQAPAAPAAEEQTRMDRRRRVKTRMLGRGYEYMDLEPDPDASASDQAAGTLGFAGAVRKEAAAQPAGLTTLASDAFGGGSTMPMMPGTWGYDAD